MRFVFDEDASAFRAAVRDLLDKECGPADVRAAWDSDAGFSAARWKQLAEMGVVGLTIAEADGGLGLDETGLVLLLEEAGRVALPEPLIETTAVGAPLLQALAPDRLAGVASGDTVVTVGLSHCPAVSGAAGADLLVLERDGALHAVAAPDVDLTPVESVDHGRRLARVDFAPAAATVIAAGDEARAAVALAFDRYAWASSAVLCGLADRMLELAAEYAKQRHQFGVPIGSFQAVKHKLADALVKLDFARPVVHRAAFSIARDDPDRAVHVSMAKAYASEAADLAARAALQVHGAIGYTWEHDLHLFMKKAWALGAAWGDAAWHRRRVADAVLPRLPR
ncbi:MAG: acyl-CoA dehydrogenase [Acidimicrobiales bacterium]|jgi:alkylation response protein AidB-like acyl-CoA dehydrogenase|nr:acyl-CoA dehydrogenase [Acidimicrobiales bacterium]